jgi:hypothetical protein
LRAVARSIDAAADQAGSDPAIALVEAGPAQSIAEALGTPASAGPAGSDTPEAPAYAILNPDGSLAGIARLDPAGLLRPRLVFDAAG